jgi:protein-tyrosine-phosphatase
MEANPKLVTCVCTANVCRSPMAEALLRHALAAEEEPLRSLEVTSAGVAAWDGDAPSANSVRALKKVGLDVTPHLSKRLTSEILQNSVIVLAMTQSHLRLIRQSFPDSQTPVVLMRGLMGEPRDAEIPDPYGLDLATYEATRDAIVEAIPAVIRHLKNLVHKAD